MSVNHSAIGGIIRISLIFYNMKVCCVFSLESPHWGDSNKYTQYTVFNIKMKIIPNYPKSAANGFLGTQERVRNSRGKRTMSVRATEVLLYIPLGIHETVSMMLAKYVILEKFLTSYEDACFSRLPHPASSGKVPLTSEDISVLFIGLSMHTTATLIFTLSE